MLDKTELTAELEKVLEAEVLDDEAKLVEDAAEADVDVWLAELEVRLESGVVVLLVLALDGEAVAMEAMTDVASV